jgi:acyl-CoA thioester hydrolase
MPARVTANADLPWFETRLRVRYAETDKMGVVYHANFVVWFEVGRTDLCKQCGFSYRDMEIEDDAHLMVTEIAVRYRRPARYDDEILIRTRVAEFAKRTLEFEYQVVNAATGETLAEGSTSHVVTSAAGRPRSFPSAQAALVTARLNAMQAAVTLNNEEDEQTT